MGFPLLTRILLIVHVMIITTTDYVIIFNKKLTSDSHDNYNFCDETYKFLQQKFYLLSSSS